MLAVRTILHPIDLSADSAAAFRLACALARDYGGRVVVMTAYPPPLTAAEVVDNRRPDGLREHLLAKLRDLAPEGPPVPIDYQVEEGDPVAMTLAVADDVRADLIVMGTHGRTGLRRAVMGSVAEAVSRKAKCPVVTVRAGVKPLSEPAPAGSAAPAGACVQP